MSTSSPRRAFVTGVTGQDGSYLAELLLAEGYEVHGLIRRASTFNTARLDGIYRDPHDPGARLFLHYGDLLDGAGLTRLICELGPDEIYNLGAQSHVRVSFDCPDYTHDVVAGGALRLFEAALLLQRTTGKQPRIYQAGSSEMFGNAATPQSEETPFSPRSPYAVAKVAAHHFALQYRDVYGLHISNGILFNHESPRRGETFVSRKITRAAARIKLGLDDKLYLGNLDARRDWGFAGDYVRAMWRMLQLDAPVDLVIATGASRSVRELLDRAFGRVGLDWQRFVEHDPRYLRPGDPRDFVGDASRARARLGWQPSLDFPSLIDRMVDADLAQAERERAARG